MRTLCGTILAAAAVGAAVAADFNVRDFGAKGDGTTKDTAAIQRAIDAANAVGGGEVLLPKGVYLCGSVFLKSGVDFHLAEGAVLKGSPDSADYNALDVAPQNWGRLGSGDNISGGHLLLCVEQKNVTLRGPGKIDGNVGAFLKMPDGSHPPTKLRIPWRPAQMIWFVESRNVTIRDVEIADAPYWSCFIYGCEGVVVERANIHTVRNPHTYNGDGLDIDSSRHVRVAGCCISSADDSITLRAAGRGRLKNDGPCADVVVSNCTFSSDCNAIRLGVGNGVIRDCSFTGIRIENTRYAVNAVGAWSRPEHGVDISNISFSDMEIDAKGFCKFYYKHATDSVFDGIAFRQVRGRVREPSIFDDTPKRPFRNLVFEDVKLEGETSPRVRACNVLDFGAKGERTGLPERWRASVVSDVGAFTCGSAPVSCYDPIRRTIYAPYLASRKGFGEQHEIVALAAIPVDHPDKAVNTVLLEVGKPLNGVGFSRVIDPFAILVGGKVRIFALVNATRYYRIDFDPATGEVGPLLPVSCRFHGSERRPLDADALAAALSSFGLSGWNLSADAGEHLICTAKPTWEGNAFYGTVTSGLSQPVVFRCEDGETFDFIGAVPALAKYECQIAIAGRRMFALLRGTTGPDYFVSDDGGRTFTPVCRLGIAETRPQLMSWRGKLLMGFSLNGEKPNGVRDGRNNIHICIADPARPGEIKEILHEIDPMGIVYFDFVDIGDGLAMIWSDSRRFPDKIIRGFRQGKDRLLFANVGGADYFGLRNL